MGVKKVHRFDVWLVELDPTRRAEIRKTRPCLIVSPDEVNRTLRTVIVAPMTTVIRYPFSFSDARGMSISRKDRVNHYGSIENSNKRTISETSR